MINEREKMYSVTLTPVPTPPISKSCPRPGMHTLHHMYHQMNAELFPEADSEANPDGFNHALLNATMQTVRVALQDDVLNVYRVTHMMPHMICVMCLLTSDPLVVTQAGLRLLLQLLSFCQRKLSTHKVGARGAMDEVWIDVT